MKKSLFLGVPAALLAGGCAVTGGSGGPRVLGAGPVTSEKRSVAGFDHIDLLIPAEVTVSVGGVESVEIIAQENLHDVLETRLEGTRLIITSNRQYSTQEPIKITIAAAHLDGFALKGSGDVKISGLESENFLADISGSGDMELEGKAEKSRLTIKGSGDIKAAGLIAKTVKAEIMGAGDITVSAADDLEAEVKGSGNVLYKGTPRTAWRVMGSGALKKLD